jgi:single-stranded-DNA-specific exonuclease
MPSAKLLFIAPIHSSDCEMLENKLGISAVLANLLINRGLRTVDEARKFLSADVSGLHDPLAFSDMPKAVDLITQAIKSKTPIMVHGDYDVDGVTSVVLLKSIIARMGGDVLHYLPHRIKEGYGLTPRIVSLMKTHQAKLLITADCGISSHAQVAQLREQGYEVIITDHHEPADGQLPAASAVINPKVKNSGYPFRELAGVGVAYKLCQALTKEKLLPELDLVALGTVADVVPLLGENRIIVKEGLSRLAQTRRLGLQALIESGGIKTKKLSTTSISFILGPRINASGRMDTAELSFDLLMSEERDQALEFARQIEAHNRARQKVEGRILEEAQDLINREVNFKDHSVIVVAKEDWHQGVLGVVASKLADRFYRPTILISIGSEFCKGSGRSIKNFHLFEALCGCKDYLHTFGGHAHAVGLVITRDNIEEFRKQINVLAKDRLRLEDLLARLEIDMELKLSQITDGLLDELALLEPCGAGNPEPLFISRNLRLKGAPQELGRETLKFWATDGVSTQEVIGFGMRPLRASLMQAARFDLVYRPVRDAWRGEESTILEAKDIFFTLG